MSSKSDKNYEDVFDKIPEIKFKKDINFGNFVIPFSQVNSIKREGFIYFGYETIPFKKRLPIYQAIFRNEFVDAISKNKNKSRLSGGSTKFSVSF